jgi:hypothetical protein
MPQKPTLGKDWIEHYAAAYPLLVKALLEFAQSGERETGLHRGRAWALLRKLGESK